MQRSLESPVRFQMLRPFPMTSFRQMFSGMHESPISVHVLPLGAGGLRSVSDFFPISRPLRSLRELSRGLPLFSRTVTITSDGTKSVRQETSRDADGNLVTTTTTTTTTKQKPDSPQMDNDNERSDSSASEQDARLLFKSVMDDMPSELKEILGIAELGASTDENFGEKPAEKDQARSFGLSSQFPSEPSEFSDNSDVSDDNDDEGDSKFAASGESSSEDADEDETAENNGTENADDTENADESDSEDDDDDDDDDDANDSKEDTSDDVAGEVAVGSEGDSNADSNSADSQDDRSETEVDSQNSENEEKAAQANPFVVDFDKTRDFSSLGAVLEVSKKIYSYMCEFL